ncbi:MAG TPA: DUF4149 domain-containing protein [Candidatus Binataceae bacterium]|nr:DUF4149 domain-containing protein [Candidatus Binataceae bacterium]
MVLFFYLLCLVLWLGGIAFFGGFVAPVLFTRLTTAQAGAVVSVILPRYHILGYACGAIGFVLALYLAAARGPRGWWLAAAAALLIALALTGYDGMVVAPQVHRLRAVAEEANPDPVLKAQFDRLHHQSARLFVLAGILDLLALASTAAALSPRG